MNSVSSNLYSLNSPIEYDAMRDAYSAYFNFNGKDYYADLVSGRWFRVPHNEVKVFAIKNDKVDFDDLYCACPPAVDEATLLEYIEKFCMENMMTEISCG